MKRYLLFILVFLLFNNCKKDDNNLQSQNVEITMGDKDVGYHDFEPFENQDTVSYLEMPNFLGIKIEENNLYSLYNFPSNSTPVFKFDLISKIDKQTFINGKNCYLWEYARGSRGQNKNYYFYGIIAVPYKIKKSGILNNDTLEINNEADKIVISYISNYTKLTHKDSIVIMKR